MEQDSSQTKCEDRAQCLLQPTSFHRIWRVPDDAFVSFKSMTACSYSPRANWNATAIAIKPCRIRGCVEGQRQDCALAKGTRWWRKMKDERNANNQRHTPIQRSIAHLGCPVWWSVNNKSSNIVPWSIHSFQQSSPIHDPDTQSLRYCKKAVASTEELMPLVQARLNKMIIKNTKYFRRSNQYMLQLQHITCILSMADRMTQWSDRTPLATHGDGQCAKGVRQYWVDRWNR